MSTIDKEFKQLADQINAKLAEAAAAMKEVNRLRKEAKLPALIDSSFVRDEIVYYYGREGLIPDDDEEADEEELVEDFEQRVALIDTSNLERELDDAGWSTSSSYC